MTNDQTAMLARYGIDYAEAMERFCGNESLFARIAVKYLDDPHVDALEAAMASGDAAAAEAKPIRSKASPATCRSCAFTTWPRESPMHCAPTISTAHAPSCPTCARATLPCWKR